MLLTPNTEKQQNIIAEKGLIFYGTKEVAEVLQCSIPTARDIMRRKDFPAVMVGRKAKVLKSALEKWAQTRRD